MSEDFAEFYAAGFAPLVVELTLYHGDPVLARSTVEDSFARLLPRWGRRGQEDPVFDIRRTAWRLTTSRWRRLRHSARPPVQPGGPEATDRLRAGLADLPAHPRMAVILADVGDASPAQIALIAHVSESTAEGWLAAGRSALDARLAVSNG